MTGPATGFTRLHQIGTKLPPELQARLDAIRSRTGLRKTAELLGCAKPTIERLEHGGYAAPVVVARVAAALEAVRMPELETGGLAE